MHSSPIQMPFNEVADIAQFDLVHSSTWPMKFKNFQAPALFSSTFKALYLGEKIQVLSRTFKDAWEPWKRWQNPYNSAVWTLPTPGDKCHEWGQTVWRRLQPSRWTSSAASDWCVPQTLRPASEGHWRTSAARPVSREYLPTSRSRFYTTARQVAYL